MTIGLIREGKNPPDKRVPFTPLQTQEIGQRFPEVEVICQASEVRCFQDDEYKDLETEVLAEVGHCTCPGSSA